MFFDINFLDFYTQNRVVIQSFFILTWCLLLYKYFSYKGTIKELKAEKNVYLSIRKFVPEVLLHVLDWTRENEFTIVPLVDEEIIQLRKENSHVYCEILRPNILKVYKFHDKAPLIVKFNQIEDLPDVLESNINMADVESIIPDVKNEKVG